MNQQLTAFGVELGGAEEADSVVTLNKNASGPARFSGTLGATRHDNKRYQQALTTMVIVMMVITHHDRKNGS
jgi:hypothetical protein